MSFPSPDPAPPTADVQAAMTVLAHPQPTWNPGRLDLTGACLFDATFTDADLTRATLEGAALADADLDGADLAGVDPEMLRQARARQVPES